MKPVLGAVLLAAVALRPLQDPRAPVPDAAKLKEAEKLIREVFKRDYEKKASRERSDLAAKLLEQAQQTQDNPASRFVLYREAQDLFAQAGQADAALGTVDRMSSDFAVDAFALKLGVLATVAKGAKTPGECVPLVDAHLQLADAAVKEDDYAAAEKALAGAVAAARRVNSRALAAKAAGQQKHLAELKGKYDKLKRVRDVLAATPDDAAGNLAMGYFQSFAKGHWDRGLTLLAKGSDAALKSLAEKDLAKPTSAPEQAALGDAWWDCAEKETGAAKDRPRARAVFWYQACVQSLSGIEKARVEKRIDEGLTEALFRGNWVDITDARQFGLTGRAGEPFEISAGAGIYRAPLARLPAGSFEGFSARVRFTETRQCIAALMFDVGSRNAYVDTRSDTFNMAHLENNRWTSDVRTACPKKDEYVITVILTGTEYVAYLDGREVGRQKALQDRLSDVALEAAYGRVTFSQVRLRRQE